MATVPDIAPARVHRATSFQQGDVPAAWVLPLYICVTMIPLSVTIIGLRLTPLRVMLLIAFVPFLLRVLRGAAGRVTVVDWLIMGHAIWIILALMVVHGPSKLPFAGITMVELVGGYFLGRVLIRNAADYQRMIRLLVFAMLFLLPFALVELFTGRLIIPELIGKVFQSIYRGSTAYGRMGLERVYAVFEHPILFGMFCSITVANLFYMAQAHRAMRFAGLALAGAMTFMSLSSAPLLACALQLMMIFWDKLTKGAWRVFLVLGVVGYLGVDALSNRTPITILIETMTFNSATGWTRIAIFEFGLENAKAHPIFGIGFNDWERPYWLTGSVDNFWLLNAMRYGFVCAAFLVFGFALHFFYTMRAEITVSDEKLLRLGHIIALAATCFTLLTVHIWGAVGVLVMFYLGAGGWFYNPDPVSTEVGSDIGHSSDQTEPQRGVHYTRFPTKAASHFTRTKF